MVTKELKRKVLSMLVSLCMMLSYVSVFGYDESEDEPYAVNGVIVDAEDVTSPEMSEAINTLKSGVQLLSTEYTSDGVNVVLSYDGVLCEGILLGGSELNIDITISNQLPPETYTPIFALYNSNDTLNSINIIDNGTSTGNYNESINIPIDASNFYAKIFVLESFDSIKCLTNSIILTDTGIDFFGNDFSTATVISDIDKSIEGKINSVEDVDVFEFVPTDSGYYDIQLINGNSIEFSFFESQDLINPIATNEISGAIAVPLDKNRTYFAKISGAVNTNYGFSLTEMNIKTISMIEVDVLSNGILNFEGDAAYYMFTISKDGYYNIKSFGDADISASLCIDSDFQAEIAYNDNVSSNDLNFEIRYELKKDETYYLKILSNNNFSSEYSVMIQYEEPSTIVKLSDSIGASQSNVTIPLYINNATNIVCFETVIECNSEIAQPISVTFADEFYDARCFISIKPSGADSVKVAFALPKESTANTPNAISGNRMICNITFKMNGQNGSGINLKLQDILLSDINIKPVYAKEENSFISIDDSNLMAINSFEPIPNIEYKAYMIKSGEITPIEMLDYNENISLMSVNTTSLRWGNISKSNNSVMSDFNTYCSLLYDHILNPRDYGAALAGDLNLNGRIDIDDIYIFSEFIYLYQYFNGYGTAGNIADIASSTSISNAMFDAIINLIDYSTTGVIDYNAFYVVADGYNRTGTLQTKISNRTGKRINDFDWYKIDTSETNKTDLKLTGNSNFYGILYDDNGLLKDFKSIGSTGAVYDLVQNKIYYLKVSSSGSVGTYNVALSTPAAAPDSVKDITALKINSGGPKLGNGNIVSFNINTHNVSYSTYTAVLCMQWDNGAIYEKASKTVIFNGTKTVSVVFSDILISGGGSTLKTFVRVYNSSGTGLLYTSNIFSSTIAGIMPAPVEFTQRSSISGKNHYYIFDDHPEFIRRCDILDPTSADTTNFGFAPSALYSKRLTSGIYTVFSYHHVGTVNEPNRYTKGAPFNNQNVYFDTVFHNSGNRWANVKITKLGISNLNWTELDSYKTWTDYAQGTYIEHYVDNGQNRFSWLSDDLGRLMQINSGNSMGYVWLMMEFEVEGTVDFCTVAYKDKTTAKQKFGNGTNISSTYETLETIKGSANTVQTLTAGKMEYLIDRSVVNGTKLPFVISNQFYTNRKQGFFSTNTSPFTPNNRWTTPQSSVINLQYEGAGVSRNPQNGMINGYVNNRIWYFDPMHTRFVESFNVPSVAKIGAYSNYNQFAPNEEFSQSWINSVKALGETNQKKEIFAEFDGLNANNLHTGKGISTIDPAYGITYEFDVDVYNADTKSRIFSYVLQGDKYYVSWKCYIDGVYQNEGYHNTTNGDNSSSVGIFDHSILSGKKATYKIYVTMMTGSSPTFHHAFYIDATADEKKVSLMNENVGNYPQN